DLGGAEVARLDGAAHHLVRVEEVALLGPVVPGEGAERARFDAHVGEVDVAVDDVGDLVAGLPGAHRVRRRAEGLEVGPRGPAEEDGALDVQLVAFQAALQDGADGGRGEGEGGSEVTHDASLHAAWKKRTARAQGRKGMKFS